MSSLSKRSRTTSSTRTTKLRRRKRRINPKRLVLACLVLLLVAEVAVAALTSPRFGIRHVDVIGNKIVSEAEVLKSVALKPGSNIFLIGKAAICSRVEKHPPVREVLIYRDLPDKVVVRVIERKPDLVLQTGGKLYEVDPSGIPFRIVDKAPEGLPIITCQRRTRVTLGKMLRSRQFTYARDCLLLVREKKNFQAAEITIDQNNELCLNVRDGFQVKLGRPEQLSVKLDKAADTVEEIPEFRKQGEYIDATTPEALALKFKE